mmetsp:Transcript_22373/g.72148  ORF Transcript_22373/g.72148 Transcript_22373/m.72148 type:complete len:402 (-) Transcript_22373:113-1318(-)
MSAPQQSNLPIKHKRKHPLVCFRCCVWLLPTQKMKVCVIGGGVAGLSAGRQLDSVVFDTGKRSVGGRCSSRLPAETGYAGAVDHAAQFVEASTPTFQAYVDDCVERGVLGRWREYVVGNRDEGIGALPKDLARGVDVEGDVWVPPSRGLRKDRKGKWHVEGRAFDAVIIAHNGKCAERITSKVESPAARILRAKFGARPATSRMTLSSIYSLVFEVDRGAVDCDDPLLRLPKGEKVLAFLGNNGAKLGWDADAGDTAVWTALTTATFGAKNKFPQEALRGTETEARVVDEILKAVPTTSAGKHPLRLRSTPRLQLWGAAVPLNAWTSDANFVWDADARLGIVGDWLRSRDATHPPSSIEAAFLSGHDLATHLLRDPGTSRGLGDGSHFVSPGELPDIVGRR